MIQFDEHIFQMGWNHQLVENWEDTWGESDKWKNSWLCRGFVGDEILPSYVGIIMNDYKDPYQTTRIQWKVRPFFFSWLKWAFGFAIPIDKYERDFVSPVRFWERKAWILRGTDEQSTESTTELLGESGHLKQTQKKTQVQASRSFWVFQFSAMWSLGRFFWNQTKKDWSLFPDEIDPGRMLGRICKQSERSKHDNLIWRCHILWVLLVHKYLDGDEQTTFVMSPEWIAIAGYHFVLELSEYDSNGYPITWGLHPNRGNIRGQSMSVSKKHKFLVDLGIVPSSG